MTVSTGSDVSVNSRVEALRAKHAALSKEVDDAQKNLSVSDFYLRQLKKQKLVVKEKLVANQQNVSNQVGA